MANFDWDPVKNLRLKAERGVSFEDVITAFDEGRVLDTIGHPNQKKYPRQRQFIIRIADYVYVVPFTENEMTIFLKTIYPSRLAKKKYLEKGKLYEAD